MILTRPNSPQLDIKALVQSTQKADIDSTLAYLYINHFLRTKDALLLDWEWDQIHQHVQQMKEYHNINSSADIVLFRESLMLSLKPFFYKELKRTPQEQWTSAIKSLTDRFFWTRLPLMRFSESHLHLHPQWVNWIIQNSLLWRESLCLRLMELQSTVDVAFIRTNKSY